MPAIDRPRLFLDTSVLISIALSTRDHPPGRYFFEMAVHGLIDLVISRSVTSEFEAVLRDRAPDRAQVLIALTAENLVLARTMIALEPNDEVVRRCVGLTGYLPDAKIVASALETACEVLVTMDSAHLIGNPKIGPPQTDLVVMSIREALDWCRDQISTRSRLRLKS